MSQPFFLLVLCSAGAHNLRDHTNTLDGWINTPSRLSQVAPRRLGKSTYTHTHIESYLKCFILLLWVSLLSLGACLAPCFLFPLSAQRFSFFFHQRQRNQHPVYISSIHLKRCYLTVVYTANQSVIRFELHNAVDTRGQVFSFFIFCYLFFPQKNLFMEISLLYSAHCGFVVCPNSILPLRHPSRSDRERKKKGKLIDS